MSSPDKNEPSVNKSKGSGTGFVIGALVVIALVLAYFLFVDVTPMDKSADINVTIGTPDN